MVQRWQDIDGDGAPEKPSAGFFSAYNFGSGTDLNFDSHLLGSPPNLYDPGNDPFNISPVAPVESIGGRAFGPPGPNPPFPDNSPGVSGGYITTSDAGGYLKYSFGIKGWAQRAHWYLAYIVVPDGPVQLTVTGQVATLGGTFAVSSVPLSALETAPPELVPEPAVGAGLAAAALAVAGVRSRRSSPR
jgi:hypothetical protein